MFTQQGALLGFSLGYALLDERKHLLAAAQAFAFMLHMMSALNGARLRQHGPGIV